MLYMLRQPELTRILLPIGDIDKTDVRAIATRLGLRTATKPDSQDVCFITAVGGREKFLGRPHPVARRSHRRHRRQRTGSCARGRIGHDRPTQRPRSRRRRAAPIRRRRRRCVRDRRRRLSRRSRPRVALVGQRGVVARARQRGRASCSAAPTATRGPPPSRSTAPTTSPCGGTSRSAAWPPGRAPCSTTATPCSVAASCSADPHPRVLLPRCQGAKWRARASAVTAPGRVGANITPRDRAGIGDAVAGRAGLDDGEGLRQREIDL